MSKKIIKKLQAHMNARGLTVADISAEVSVAPQTVEYWLEGMHMKPATPVSSGFENDVLQQLSQLVQRLTLPESTIANAADLYLEQAIALEARALAQDTPPRPAAINRPAPPV